MLSLGHDIMGKVLKAVYENGVFRPLEPVALEEHQTLTITLNDLAQKPDADSGESCFDILDKLGLVGAIDDAPDDLSTNKAHFENFGQE